MTTKLFEIAAFIAEGDGDNLGQFIGLNFGDGLIVTDQGKVLAVRVGVLENQTLVSPTISGTVTSQLERGRIVSVPGEAVTLAAASVTLAQFAMLDNTSCRFDFTAGMKAQGIVAKAGSWDGKAVFYRVAGAAPVLVAEEYGTPLRTTVGDDVAFVIDGNSILVVATSADGDDRNWNVELRVQEELAT